MVKNQVHSSQSGTFDISAAMLHIIAMTFMLMDHLWATLLPAQDWLTCVGSAEWTNPCKNLTHSNLYCKL